MNLYGTKFDPDGFSVREWPYEMKKRNELVPRRTRKHLLISELLPSFTIIPALEIFKALLFAKSNYFPNFQFPFSKIPG